MNRMTELVVGDWILMQWISGMHDQEIIHPDDLERLKSELPYGGLAASISLFLITGVCGDYFEITRNGQNKFRALRNSNVLRKVQYSGKFRIGDYVKLIDSEKTMIVFGIAWHYNNNEPFFTLSDGKKVSSRRYWGSEIRNLPAVQL